MYVTVNMSRTVTLYCHARSSELALVSTDRERPPYSLGLPAFLKVMKALHDMGYGDVECYAVRNRV
jgi:hypothetical protein